MSRSILTATLLAEIAQIDAAFEKATDWGSWMAMRSADRQRLVRTLKDECGAVVADKWELKVEGN